MTSLKEFLERFGAVGAALNAAAGTSSLVVSYVSGQVAAAKLPPGEANALPVIATIVGIGVLFREWWEYREMHELDLFTYPYKQRADWGLRFLLASGVAFAAFYLLANARLTVFTWIAVFVFAFLFTRGIATVTKVVSYAAWRDRVRKENPDLPLGNLADGLPPVETGPTDHDKAMGALALEGRPSLARLGRAVRLTTSQRRFHWSARDSSRRGGGTSCWSTSTD